jgi:hypothetical protein
MKADALLTLDQGKRALGLQNSCSRDVDIIELIEDVSDYIATYCGRIFQRQTYRQLLPSPGSLLLQLDQYPIVSVQQVLLIGGCRVFENDSPLGQPLLVTNPAPNPPYSGCDPNRFTVLKASGQLYRAAGWWWSPTYYNDLTMDPNSNAVLAAIQVDYTAGFITPPMAEAEETVNGCSTVEDNLPSGVRRAAIRMLQFVWNNGPGIHTELMPGQYKKELFEAALDDEIENWLSVHEKGFRSMFPAQVV